MEATEVWNSWESRPPPVASVKQNCRVEDIKEINSILFDAISVLKRLQFLHKEAAVLSRFLYRFKRIFRHDKGVQQMTKINQCLLRYLKLNLHKTLSDFKQALPIVKNESKGMQEFYLPTRQRLQWVLLRLQAFSKLFLRVIDIAKEAVKYLIGRLSIKWSTTYMMILLGLAGRIFVISKFLLSRSIEWYNSLHKYLSVFTQTTDYLQGYNFPANLKTWLNYEDVKYNIKKVSVDDIFEYIDLVKEDEEGDEVIVVGDELDIENKDVAEKNEWENLIMDKVRDLKVVEEKIEKETTRSFLKRPRNESEDLGVPVEMPKKKKKKEKGKKCR